MVKTSSSVYKIIRSVFGWSGGAARTDFTVTRFRTFVWQTLFTAAAILNVFVALLPIIATDEKEEKNLGQKYADNSGEEAKINSGIFEETGQTIDRSLKSDISVFLPYILTSIL